MDSAGNSIASRSEMPGMKPDRARIRSIRKSELLELLVVGDLLAVH